MIVWFYWLFWSRILSTKMSNIYKWVSLFQRYRWARDQIKDCLVVENCLNHIQIILIRLRCFSPCQCLHQITLLYKIISPMDADRCQCLSHFWGYCTQQEYTFARTVSYWVSGRPGFQWGKNILLLFLLRPWPLPTLTENFVWYCYYRK